MSEEPEVHLVNGHISSSSSSANEAEQPAAIPFQLRNNRANNREKRSREASRLVGTVKWFNAKVGYGFITRHDTGEDIFVHFTAITRKNPRHSMKSLGDGEIVEFNIMAANVTAPGKFIFVSRNIKICYLILFLGGGPVRGNPYVSYIPVRRNDSFAAGDPGIILPLRRFPRSIDYGTSRIPRWSPNTPFRNMNM